MTQYFVFTNKQQNFTFNYDVYERAPLINPHYHDFYEIYMFLKGDAVYSVEGNIYDLSNQDILFTNVAIHLLFFMNKSVCVYYSS